MSFVESTPSLVEILVLQVLNPEFALTENVEVLKSCKMFMKALKDISKDKK